METVSRLEPQLQITKPSPNPMFGKISSLSYHGNSNNLVEIKMEDQHSGDTFSFSAYSNVNSDFHTIKIVNLNDFCFRLQEAFNNEFLVSIFHEDGKIVLLEITKQIFLAVASITRPSTGGDR